MKIPGSTFFRLLALIVIAAGQSYLFLELSPYEEGARSNESALLECAWSDDLYRERPAMQHQLIADTHASRTGLSFVIREAKLGDDVSAFRTLNEEWIVRFFSLEEEDRKLLGDPENTILRRGGHIFMAWRGEESVGCLALLPAGNGIYELSKMAVLPGLRNHGIGHQLLAHAIREARLLGAVSLSWRQTHG